MASRASHSPAYQAAGVDMFHVSAGGEATHRGGRKTGHHVAYQVPLARQIKEALQVPVIAVGRLMNPHWRMR